MDSLRQSALDALLSSECLCGSPKVKNQSFCRACYFALPGKLRQDLYKPLSDGYAEVWDEAKTYLLAETNRCRQGRLL